MGQTATLTKTGQITIPKWVREYLDVKPGQAIVFRKAKDGGMEISREKTAEEIAEEIDRLIPDDVRKYHMENFAGMLAKEAEEKWANSDEGRAYFREEMERTL